MKRRPTHPLPGQPRDRIAAVEQRHYGQDLPGEQVAYAEPNPICGALPGPKDQPDQGRVYGCGKAPHHKDRHVSDAEVRGVFMPRGWTWPQS